MFHCAFRSLGRPYSIRALVAGVIVCGCAVVIVHADERPTKPADSSVAKVVAPRQDGSSTTSEKPSKKHIQQLIQDLGSSHYTARRAASTELRQIGPDAFDLLDAATDNADPEVASSATYLLRQIPVRWVQPDDNAFVRSQ